jgi:hypothetical protein
VVLYDSADYWRSVGVSEGFGLPPLEALACGCVVFSSLNHALADPLAWQADPRSLTGLLDDCSEAELVRRWEWALGAIEAHWRRVLEQGFPPLVSPAPWRLRLDGRLVRLRRWLRG